MFRFVCLFVVVVFLFGVGGWLGGGGGGVVVAVVLLYFCLLSFLFVFVFDRVQIMFTVTGEGS